MASVQFDKGKCKGGAAVKAAFKHNDCSPEMRAIAAKGNPDIDVSKSHLNVNLTGTTYRERCDLYDARIAKLDATPGANVRKDRTTGQKLVVPVPPGLPPDKAVPFLTRVHEVITDLVGAENVMSADIHVDEKHEYVDSTTNETVMSREHLQEVVLPVVDGKLNGKKFFTKGNMRRFNAAVQDMARAEFGVDFLTGKGTRSRSTAELKADSIVAAAKLEAEDIGRKIRFKKTLVDSREKRLAERERVVKDAERAVEASRRAAEEEAREVMARAEETARHRLKTAAEAIDQQYDILVDQADAVQRAADAVAARERAVEMREQNAAREIAAGRRALAADVSSGVDDKGIKYKTSRALPTYGGD